MKRHRAGVLEEEQKDSLPQSKGHHGFVALKVSQRSRQEVLEQARKRYQRRGKEGRSRILDEVCALCGYERKYAIKVLGGKRSIPGLGRPRGGSQPVYGDAERASNGVRVQLLTKIMGVAGLWDGAKHPD